ncbi:MAG: hypothetical protein ACJAT3_002411 [Akkermansiaceae bacterium]|jgi:hypothetical protein
MVFCQNIITADRLLRVRQEERDKAPELGIRLRELRFEAPSIALARRDDSETDIRWAAEPSVGQ